MRLNTQTDKRWAYDIMTFPKNQKNPDYLHQYGCLVSSIANIIQILTGHEYNPSDLNKYLVENKGYAYLRNPKCPKGQESFVLYDVIENYWGLRIENVETSEYKKHPNTHYIARFKNKGYSHYSNVMTQEVIHGKRWFEVFNVFDGETVMLPVAEITLLKRVTS